MPLFGWRLVPLALSHRSLCAAGLLATLSLSAPSVAQELRIGMKAAIDSADPHLLFTPSRNVQLHVWEPLVVQDAQVKPTPGLATSWRAVDDSSWEFTLREDARFHDGTPLTAEDVVFSIRRAQTIEGVRTYRAYIRDIASVEAAGPHRVIIRTRAPSPLLPNNLSTFGIASARAAQGASAEDFNGGRAAIGTGPYRWGRWTPGQDVVLERNDDYRAGRQPWSRVTFRFLGNDSARVAALLSGDVDVVDAVPAGLYERVQNNGGRTRLETATSLFALNLTLDNRAQTNFVTGADGKPLAENPLAKREVRQALSHAINRAAIAERAMEGGAVPAGQYMPPGFLGHVPGVQPAAYDPALSRRLLAQAGYPQGFGLTLHCLNDRFYGDSKTCQAMGQMFTAIGIRTTVEALPSAIFFRRAQSGANGQPEFSASMSIFGSAAGLPDNAFTSLVQSYDPARGRGTSNLGRHSNPELDALIDKAAATFDDAERQAVLERATRIVFEQDLATIPVFYLKGAWGLRQGLAMEPRGDQYTLATGIRPAN
ncbi:ABC transporter, substrate-binding protein, family 5 [Acetobacteraceae bacterium AT-5844]|nr:ABC transporter, substrate-binding protein, family 5 [Acetobacteraceae bacterium AT-5844]